MSLIHPRHVCSKCDGYVGAQFRNLSSRCDCDQPTTDDLIDEQRMAREHSADPDDPESRAHLND